MAWAHGGSRWCEALQSTAIGAPKLLDKSDVELTNVMSRAMSVYLDLLRFLAAVAVFFHHLPRVTPGDDYQLFASHGDDAVMVFFVLSGFVIAYVTEHKERDPVNYMASRFARLWSVAIPALLLTLIFDFIGRRAGTALYEGWYVDSLPLVRLAASLTFTNQLWSFDIRPFGNPPYWSISYEFWYYVFFALLVFAKRWWLIALWAVFVGPVLLLLLPVWMAGVYVYRASKTFTVSRSLAWVMAIAPVIAYIVYCSIGMREILTGITDRHVVALTGDMYYLHKSRFFLHDYAITVLLCIHFLGVAVITRAAEWKLGANVITKVAAYTFTLYLLHFPLLLCVASQFPNTPDIVMIAIVAIVVWAIGSMCEQKKGVLRRWLLGAWSNVRPLLPISRTVDRA